MKSDTVIENWIKPPKIVQYQNAHFISMNGNTLICEFLFPEKYSTKPFFINGEKILDAEEMYLGRRFFYSDRYYALLEYYSKDMRLTAYYIDITLPAILNHDHIWITDLKLDFWVFPDQKRYILLDEDELEHAIKENLFNQDELKACYLSRDHIRNALDRNNFNEIFTNYPTSNSKIWDRYNLI